MLQMHGAFLSGDMGIHNAQEIKKAQLGIKRNDSGFLSSEKGSGRDIVFEPKPDLDMGMIEGVRLHGIDNGTGDAAFLENAQEDKEEKEKTQGILKAKERIA